MSECFHINNPDHLRERAAAIEAHLKGDPVEYLDMGEDKWSPSSSPLWTRDTRYRPAPKPEWVPWTFDTIKERINQGPLWIQAKEGDKARIALVLYANLSEIVAMDEGRIPKCASYVRLFSEFTQIDGKPCGTEVAK